MTDRVWVKNVDHGGVYEVVNDPDVLADFLDRGWHPVSADDANPVDLTLFGTYDGDDYKKDAKTKKSATSATDKKE